MKPKPHMPIITTTNGSGGGGHSHSKAKPQTLRNFFYKILLRRSCRFFLIVPLFYISGLLMCVGTFSGFFGPRPLPGSVYRSHEVFAKLWPDIRDDNATGIQLSSTWTYNRRHAHQKSCAATDSRKLNGLYSPNGYLIVEANGGLNQQRSSICNAVALAGLLNAILVIPRLSYHSVWKDPSGFEDIYDEDHFIATLEGYVTVVREIPETLMERYKYNISKVPIIGVKAWAPVSYYMSEVYPILHKQGIVRITPFANRLANDVPADVQLLRCMANYKALRFSNPIETLAKELVQRMVEKSSRTGGKFVSVHLRFEEDMVAFSCCLYDGGETEKKELTSAREKGWIKFKHKDRVILPGVNRLKGNCPLTPLEVGMMLRAMGFNNNTSIYLASGKIYQSTRNLAPLLQMFPLVQTKESLATSLELAVFKGYSSRLAALDYNVCLASEVFITTQGGNFPHFLRGHRWFLYGHAKTIKPDKRALVLLLQNTTISWTDFKKQMGEMLVKNDREGTTVPRYNKTNKRSSIFAHPVKECRCLHESSNSTIGSGSVPHLTLR